MGNSPLEQAVGDGVKGTFITFSVYSLVFLIANLQCVSDLETCRRHVPTLWCRFSCGGGGVRGVRGGGGSGCGGVRSWWGWGWI